MNEEKDLPDLIDITNGKIPEGTVIVHSSDDLLKMLIMKRLVKAEHRAKNAKILIIDSGYANQRVNLRGEQEILFHVLALYQVEILIAYRTDFHQTPSKPPKIPPELPYLKSVSFWSCANTGSLMLRCLNFCPKLQTLSEQGELLKGIGMTHDETRREVSGVTRKLLVSMKGNENYNLIELKYQRLENRQNQDRPPFQTKEEFDRYDKVLKDLRHVKGNIDYYVERNRKGYAKCRAAIYQLFLIKKFIKDGPFKLLDKNVVLIIAKFVYQTIGTKIWCL